MEKVIAVVVTYNRQTLLSECVNALRQQTRPLDAILIINNGSTDNTPQWLTQQHDLIFINQSNTGSSGGFSTGINMAYKEGYSWIWCMDDDGYPKEDALQNLLDSDDGNIRLLNCAVIDKRDKKSFVWKTLHYRSLEEVDEEIIEGIGHPFNGTLLHRRIIERVGFPKPKYFLWGDETEYYYRIVKKNNIPVRTIPGSIHYHPSTAFSIKKDWDYNSAWKMYFYVRNRFHVHCAKFHYKIIALIHYCCFLVAFAGIVLVYQKTNRIKKLRFIFWPATDAFTNNFQATPKTVLTKLNSQPILSLNKTINDYLKSIWSGLLSPFISQRNRSAANA